MSIYAISDLHLSFGINKPMDIFGENWKEYEARIKEDWISKVNKDDTVLLLGDFSWATYLEETYKDFKYLNDLPGKKIMLKGNHDYWWTTLNSMKIYLKENKFEDISFLYNNSYLIENNIISGTRGWSLVKNKENEKIINREKIRLELSIKDGINKYGKDKQIIVCMHYPPITLLDDFGFLEIMKKYNVTKCIYGHLHGESQKYAKEGLVDGIDMKMLSADYTKFKLVKIV